MTFAAVPQLIRLTKGQLSQYDCLVSLLYFYLISTGWRDGSLAGSLLVLGRRANAGPNLIRDNSRLGEFYSRLGGREFPVRAATGIRSEGFVLPYYYSRRTAIVRAKSTKFPVSTGKTGNIASSAERAAASLSRQQSRLSASLSAG